MEKYGWLRECSFQTFINNSIFKSFIIPQLLYKLFISLLYLIYKTTLMNYICYIYIYLHIYGYWNYYTWNYYIDCFLLLYLIYKTTLNFICHIKPIYIYILYIYMHALFPAINISVGCSPWGGISPTIAQCSLPLRGILFFLAIKIMQIFFNFC